MNSNRFEPVKVGVIGMGNFGRLHALTLAGLAESELVAVVARRQASLDTFNEDMPGVPGWLDLDAAIAESGAEAWVIASSTSSHIANVSSVLKAGKAALLEKPISDNLKDAEAIAELVNDDSTNLMLGHILLFSSEFRQLMNEVEQRGPVQFISSVRHRPNATLDLYPGETPFHLLMTHDLYAVLALVNRAEPKRFCAQVRRTVKGEIDLALAQLQWEEGIIASLEASFMTTPGMTGDGFDRMEVFGEEWMSRLLPNPRPIEVWDERALWPMALEIRADPTGPSGMLAEELRCFCRVVRGIEAVPLGATYADAIQVQRWIDRLENAVQDA
jgi:predicted dehydrogenase